VGAEEDPPKFNEEGSDVEELKLPLLQALNSHPELEEPVIEED
jgi:hypothetical protein